MAAAEVFSKYAVGNTLGQRQFELSTIAISGQKLQLKDYTDKHTKSQMTIDLLQQKISSPINILEFRQLLLQEKQLLQDDLIVAIFQQLDSDKDGLVMVDDFYTFL